jgi:exonuclease VII small subunit
MEEKENVFAEVSAPEIEEEVIEQDPLKEELERVNKKRESGRTELEKAEYKLQQVQKQIRILRGDDQEEIAENEDERPLTIGEYKKMQQTVAVKTAVELADEVTNETERELLKYHLENTIKSTGNPQEDLSTARAIVNSKRNELLLSEAARKGVAKTHSTGSSAPAKEEVKQEVLPTEVFLTRPPFNMTPQEIIAKRVK